MDSGDPGVPGVAVHKEVGAGLENVILLLQLLKERPVLVIGVRLKDVIRILAPIIKVMEQVICFNDIKVFILILPFYC